MRVAVFDYKTVPNNPTGGCHRRMLSGLCHEHEFTVFATEFDNPCPERNQLRPRSGDQTPTGAVVHHVPSAGPDLVLGLSAAILRAI